MRDVVIVAAARTPIGAMNGSLAEVTAPRLGATAIKEVLKRANLAADQVDEVIMGNVLMAGQGQAPARQACLYAGLPTKVECMTINKVCGSGAKAIALAEQAIRCGANEIFVAGGMESMSNGPYALHRARRGYRMGNGELVDLMIHDGLWDPYKNQHMGSFGDLCAREKGFTREDQDRFATESYRRAIQAQEEGWFKDEIVPVEIPGRKGDVTLVYDDESPRTVKFEKIPTLKPAFGKEGTVTAANASSINDAGAAVLVMSRDKADELGLVPLAKIISHASHAEPPEWFTIAPVGATVKALQRADLTAKDIELWEINEAFSVVTLYAIRELGLSHEIVNVHGGAVALGHPIGCTGARLMVTLLYAMERYGKQLGAISMCIGGGEALTMIVEKL